MRAGAWKLWRLVFNTMLEDGRNTNVVPKVIAIQQVVASCSQDASRRVVVCDTVSLFHFCCSLFMQDDRKQISGQRFTAQGVKESSQRPDTHSHGISHYFAGTHHLAGALFLFRLLWNCSTTLLRAGISQGKNLSLQLSHLVFVQAESLFYHTNHLCHHIQLADNVLQR